MKPNTNFSLSIPTPCHENWEHMTPEDKGRFCLQCQKTVVDFSMMSDKEIVQFVNHAKGKICGRFDSRQLNRELIVAKEKRWYKPVSSIAAILSALYLFIPTAKGKTRDNVEQNTSCRKNADTTQPLPEKKRYDVITGTVKDENGDSLRGVTIRFDTTYSGTHTSPEGKFKLRVPSEWKGDSANLHITFMGFAPLDIPLSLLQEHKLDIILLPAICHNTGDVILVVNRKPSFWRRIYKRRHH